ncbi:hypothetical protein [Gallibacterium anatis]|uniref:capsular polysaccharide export protein, LipB/KpsS family n=1 Tax=Gallibacterium anatis TaxID=750 RepID=UPI0030065EC7
MNHKSKFSVDIIIPVRARDDYSILPRLEMRNSYDVPTNFNFIIVDFGSPIEQSNEIREVCLKNGFKYYYMDRDGDLFNLSAIRNLALLKSEADYVIFEDLDLVSSKDFYYQINRQIKSLILKNNWPFFVIPVAYLSESRSESINTALDIEDYDDLISDIYKGDHSDNIEYFAPVSSYLVCSRRLAILSGGFDESYEGWGFEDSDFEVKLLKNSNIDKPREFYKLDTRPYYNQVQWRGWRALFKIFGDIVAQKGIYSFHKWHPIAEHRSDSIRQKNHKIFLSNSDYYFKMNSAFTPLWNPEKPSNLFLNRNPHIFNYEVFSLFENPLLIEEKDFSIINIDNIIEKYNIESVILNNPYGNEKRRAIYEAFKSRDIKCYVIERGALPWSICIDSDGFCAESSSYNPEFWLNKEFTKNKLLKTQEYINDLKTSGASLEPQSSLIGGKNLKRVLFGESENTKILFIALQSPSDTTTNFFCGNIKSYDNFINEIKLLPSLLDGSDWKIIYKNHPLSVDKVSIPNALNVDNYHIGDILDACDAVTLINSGVGVLAAAYHKPVYIFGQAFYRCEGINKQVLSSLELSKMLLREPMVINKDLCLKFISFLINDFYSFAKWDRQERKYTDKANLSISKNIKYDIVRICEKGEIKKEISFSHDNVIDLRKSILFDRYRLDDYLDRIERQKKDNRLKNVVKPTTETKEEKKQKVKNSDINKLEKKDILDKSDVTHSFKRKVKKLFKNPTLFFADYFMKRVK